MKLRKWVCLSCSWLLRKKFSIFHCWMLAISYFYFVEEQYFSNSFAKFLIMKGCRKVFLLSTEMTSPFYLQLYSLGNPISSTWQEKEKIPWKEWCKAGLISRRDNCGKMARYCKKATRTYKYRKDRGYRVNIWKLTLYLHSSNK